MTRELNRVALAALIGFVLMALVTAFWAVVEADDLRAREDNARNVIAEQRIERGAIYDRNGALLATSEEIDDTGWMRRVYPHPDAASAVGYYSLTYGEEGIEAAYNDVLRGDTAHTTWRDLWDEALHRPQAGGDVRATIELDVQQAAADALKGRRGAAVVVEVPSGEVLGMVSQPGYDPNSLEADWDRLVADKEESPLLNRVAAGVYQPGGAWQTVMLAALLAAYPDLNEEGGYILNSEIADAQAPIQVGDVTLTCLPGTPDAPMTLVDAYAYDCPAPFARALDDSSLTPARLWERLGVFGLLAPPDLAGFHTGAGPAPEALTDQTDAEALRAALVGQGRVTLSPLQMVEFIAALANGGSAVPLHPAQAVRPSADAAWQSVPLPARRPALIRGDVAEAVAMVMQQAAAENPLVAAALPGSEALHGHVGLAYAGPQQTPYAWFTGFVDLQAADPEAPQSVAVVVVVENEDDPAAAVQVARAAFEAALAE